MAHVVPSPRHRVIYCRKGVIDTSSRGYVLIQQINVRTILWGYLIFDSEPLESKLSDNKEGTADIFSCGLVRHSVIPYSLGSFAREGAWEGTALIPVLSKPRKTCSRASILTKSLPGSTLTLNDVQKNLPTLKARPDSRTPLIPVLQVRPLDF